MSFETRRDFYKSFPQGGLVIEVGVLRGDNAINIYNFIKSDRLILIDTWDKDCYDPTTGELLNGEETYQKCKNKFSNRFNVDLWRGKSEDLIPKLKNKSVNFAFIDTYPYYEDRLAALEAMLPKMSSGGWLCGHDYCEIFQYGVVRAVAVFIDRHNLKIDKLTDYPLAPVTGSDRKYYSTQTSYNSFGILIP